MSESLLVKAGSNSLGSCGYSFDPGVLGNPVDGFVTPQLRSHHIERPLLCQTSANCFCCVGGMIDQFGLSVSLGAVFLGPAYGSPIDVQSFGIDFLVAQGADYTFQ